MNQIVTDTVETRVKIFICMLCETVHFAIDELSCNPILEEMCLHFKNEKGVAMLRLGGKYVEGESFGYGQITNNTGTYLLSRYDILTMYKAARGQPSEVDSVVFIMALLCQRGEEPTISTSVTIKPEFKKYILKPRFDSEGILLCF